MSRPLPLARLGFRSPIHSPEAMRAALAVCEPREVALSLLGSFYFDQQPAVRAALRASDLGESRDAAWVTAQLRRRRSYYRERVAPLLEAAGSPVSYPEAVSSWCRWLREEPDTVSIV